MFSKYMYKNLIIGFWSGNFILMAPYPDHCLLVPFCILPDSKALKTLFLKSRHSNLGLCFDSPTITPQVLVAILGAIFKPSMSPLKTTLLSLDITIPIIS